MIITKEVVSVMRAVKSGTICDEFALKSRTRVKLAGLCISCAVAAVNTTN